MREEQQVDEVGGAVGVLPADDGFAVAAYAFGELFLGESGVLACCAEVGPDVPLAGGYLVGEGVSWHPNKL